MLEIKMAKAAKAASDKVINLALRRIDKKEQENTKELLRQQEEALDMEACAKDMAERAKQKRDDALDNNAAVSAALKEARKAIRS